MYSLDHVVNNGILFVNLYDSKFNKASLYFMSKTNKYMKKDLYYFVYHDGEEPIKCTQIMNVYPRVIIKNWDKNNIHYEILNEKIFNKWKKSKDTGPKYFSQVSPVNGLETELDS